MGNTKTYYIDGQLLPGTTLEQFKAAASTAFHYNYCVAEIVEPAGGYLGVKPEEGPFLVGAIHCSSIGGDQGPELIAKLFHDCIVHRLDADWGDMWYTEYEDGVLTGEWRSPHIELSIPSPPQRH